MTLLMIFAMCGITEVAHALPPQSKTGQAGTAQPDSQQTNPQVQGTTVDPTVGPLSPSPSGSTLPNAPSETAPQSQPSTVLQQQPSMHRQPVPEPLGTAAAEGIKTTGNGASRPAGTAIAPAKQGQRRSLLIKLGAIAAAGVAVGTVYALSKGTSSTPPNYSARGN